MVSIESAKALFDFDIIAGMIVAIIIHYAITLIMRTAAPQYLVSVTAGTTVTYDDAITLFVEAIGAIGLKGRTRKIMLTAFFFSLFLTVCKILRDSGIPVYV